MTMAYEPDEESWDELYARERSKPWPSQRDQLWTALLGALEEPLVKPRKQEANELRRRLHAEDFFGRLERASELRFTLRWRKDLCVTIVSLKDMAPWDGGGRAKSLKAMLRQVDENARLATEIEDGVAFRAVTSSPYLPDEFREVVRLPRLLRQWKRLVREIIGNDTGNSKKVSGEIALQCLAGAFERAGGKVAASWGSEGYLDGPFVRYLKEMWKILPPEIGGKTPEAFARRAKRILRLLRQAPGPKTLTE